MGNLNPVSIRITYEVDSGGPSHLVDGINAEFAVADNLNLGARFAQDHDPVTDFKLFGADSVWHLNSTTTVTVDLARSEGNQLEGMNSSGVLTPVSAAAVTSSNPSGNAGRIEIVHRDETLDARAYAAKTDMDFETPTQPWLPGAARPGRTAPTA